MEDRYIRNLGAITQAEQAILGQKKVFVAGCGGLGGYLIEMLLRLGVGHIAAADGDVFEWSNLNRQLYSAVDLIGQSKAEAAGRRAALVNPAAEFHAYPVHLDRDNTPRLIEGCDAVLDALDNIPARKMLAGICGEMGIPLIHGAIRGWTAQAAVSLPGDGLLDLLYPEGAALSGKESLSFSPPFCAAMEVALCVKLLLGRPVEPGRVYYADLLDMEFETI